MEANAGTAAVFDCMMPQPLHLPRQFFFATRTGQAPERHLWIGFFLHVALLLIGGANFCLAQDTPSDVADLAVPWPPPANSSDSPFAKFVCNSYAGYSVEGKPITIHWGDIKPNDFGDQPITFDYSGIRKLGQVPPPGVHPRILCTPDDLADIQHRLKETRCGQEAWKNLLCFTEMMKGKFQENADYNQGSNKIQYRNIMCRVPLARLGGGSTTEECGALYQALVQGDTTKTVPPGFWAVYPLEAFRCWTENDGASAKDLSAAVITSLHIEQRLRAATGKEPPYEQPIAGVHLAYIYDFLFNFMTPDQQKEIHDELANGTWSHDNYGTFNAANNSRSNWATFFYWLNEVLAIEGEPGFNDLKVRGMYRGWRNMTTYGWFQSGATFEGEAKDQLGVDGYLAFARRANAYGFENLAAHPFARAYLMDFIPKSLLPTQDGFLKYDLLGGAHQQPSFPDLLGYKFLMPDNKIVDFAYRRAVGENYENVPNRCEMGYFNPINNGGYGNPLMFALIYACDFDPANNDPSKLGISPTFFCGERALMMTRSSWDKDALMLNLHTREANGGHPFQDRNGIFLAGAGRVWANLCGLGYQGFKNIHNSVVLIDDHEQGERTPARMVDFVDNSQATFAVGDAKYAWDWILDEINPYFHGCYFADDVKNGKIKLKPGWELETHCVNDFSFTKRTLSSLLSPMCLSPHWLKKEGALWVWGREENYPVQKAFRTAGLVRGPHPYALVIDDIQKDASSHDYRWNMAVEHDIQIASTQAQGDHQLDVLLTGGDSQQKDGWGANALPARMDSNATIPAGQPVLLVRFLNLNHEPSPTSSTADTAPLCDIVEDRIPPGVKAPGYGPCRTFSVKVHAVSPDFKVLLYAFHQGDALPQTSWSGNQSVRIAWADQDDRVGFSMGSSGKTDVSVLRNGQCLVDLHNSLPALPEEAAASQ